jgi:hypothetical protein
VIDRHLARTLLVAVLAGTFVAKPVAAQGPGGAYAPMAYRGFVGLNPLGIPFDIFSIEAEGWLLPGFTVGGSGSYNSVRGDIGAGGRDPRFGSGDVKVRYYPAEIPFRGLAVGLGLGVTRYSSVVQVASPAGLAEDRQHVTAPTISIFGDYNYLIGARQRFIVGTGVGAKRLLASEEERDRADAPRAWVFVRFVLGLAF